MKFPMVLSKQIYEADAREEKTGTLEGKKKRKLLDEETGNSTRKEAELGQGHRC